MRYLSLSIILSLLSFNSYGAENKDQPFTLMSLFGDVQGGIIAEAVSDDPQTVVSLSQVSRDSQNLTNAEVERNVPLKEMCDLTEKRDDWIESAKQAGIDDNEPNHLLEILEVEKTFFAELLKQKESTIGNNPVEWKKHALANLLSYNAIRIAAWNAANNAANNAAKKAAWIGTRNAAWNVADDAAWNVARNAAWNVAYNAAYEAARNAVNGLSRPNKIGRVAYRVAETQTWITVLDPSLHTFEKSYDAAYSKLNDISEEDLGEWFRSQEDFESKLNEYFVNREGLNDRSKQFLEHVQNHLNRMIPKMFPSAL